MKTTLLTFLAGSAIVLNSHTAHAQWQQTKGPGAGNIRDMIVDADNNIYLANSGGIYFSDDAGLSWSLRVNGIQAGLDVGYLDTMGSTVFAAGGQPGATPLYMSTDNGANWTDLSANLPAFYIYGLEHIGNRLLMPAGDGLYFSDDMGQSWDTISTYMINENQMPNPAVWSAMVLDGYIYSFIYSTGLWRTADFGANWESVNGNYQPSSHPIGLASTGTALFLSHPESSSESYRSVDNGATWSIVDACGGSCPIRNFNYLNGLLYGSTGFGMYTSTNDGATWNLLNTPPSSQEYKGIIESNGTWITATGVFGLGILRSSNNGTSWQESNYGYAGSRVQALLADGNTLFASDYEMGMMSTTDAGDTYLSIDNPNIFQFYSGDELVKSGSFMYLGGYSRVFRTNNGGTSWEQVITGLPPIFQVNDMMVDGTDIYLGCEGGLYKSTTGTNWTAVGGTGLPAGFQVFGICKKGNRLFISGQTLENFYETYGHVFYSDNNGASWIDVSAQFNFQIYSSSKKMHVSGDNILLACSQGPFISTDNGITFNPITNGMTPYSVGNPTRWREHAGHVYANGPGGVFASGDNGFSWASITDNLFTPWVHDMAFLDDMIYVATEWGGIWKRPVADILVGVPSQSKDGGLVVYPNPTSDALYLSAKGLAGAQLSLIATDGRVVFNSATNSDQIQVPTTDLANGLYVVRATKGSQVFTTRVMVQH